MIIENLPLPEDIIKDKHREFLEHYKYGIRLFQLGKFVFHIKADFASALWRSRHSDVDVELFDTAANLLLRQNRQAYPVTPDELTVGSHSTLR